MSTESAPEETKDGSDAAVTRQYKSADRRRREIVGATLAILAEQGMHAWTTSALAERVGVSEATLFKHFESKDDILSAALKHQAEELRDRVEGYRPEGSRWESAAGLALEVLEYMEETGGGPLVILLGHAARIRPDMRDEVERTAGLFRGRVVELLGESGGGPQRGAAVLADRAEVLADLIVATVQSSCLRWSVRGREGSLAGRAEPLLAYLAETLRPPEEAP